MEGMPNRRERRALAKKMGLLRKRSKMPLKEWLESTKRSAEIGKMIHSGNVERVLRQQDADEAEKNAKRENQDGAMDSQGQ